MREIPILLLVSMLVLALIEPSLASAQMLTDVYYFDAQQGYWYAINVGSKTFRVFYLDSQGNAVFISAYRWDLNTSYIIFQAPCNCRIYLREEVLTYPTLYTKGWFSNLPSSPLINITVSSSYFSGSKTVTGSETINVYYS